jgi:hypothetical protein
LVWGPSSNLDTETYIRPTFRSVCMFLGPFGGAQMPQSRMKKKIFWLFRTISTTRMGLLIRLGAYFQAKTSRHTSRLLAGLFGPFGGAQMPQHGTKTYFLVVPDHFFLKDMVSGLFSSLNIGTYNLPTCRPFGPLLDQFGGAQIPQNCIKKLFLGCFILFLLQKRA